MSDPGGREERRDFRRIAILASAIARSIAFAIGQPEGVDVSEIIARPTANP
jgi:NADP-dependent 3-hydroxy acid dehydrogenase YdfG